ncbi:NUDIX hydrolase [Deinococcus roseus]|uniref:NUDIX hydrolase n=1 Tax=Deinococcus roseus TaxID=392414 RepID=A0ABQ2D6B7_9DEIO|nr:NUDIX hydrolase [Deinococcus roseus]GGJ46283.1 NUDIX hydrolase [Deinococcus roseus]
MANHNQQGKMVDMRNIALGIAEHDEKILVYQSRNPDTGLLFCRALGGGIEHGEHSRDALKREFMEELGAEIEILEFLGVIEDIFQWNGKTEHQISFNYRIRFTNPVFYEQRSFKVLDDSITAFWKPIADFQKGLKLYPTGILEQIIATSPDALVQKS